MSLILLACSLALTTTAPQPVLVELFSSEGCSSCPPADALLRELDLTDPSALVLEFHVDYWNSLGWRDPFSAAAFSDRQASYARQLTGDDHIYTPQAIVDGRDAFVGSDSHRLRDALARARHQVPKSQLQITIAGETLDLNATGLPAAGDLWVAVTESNLSTSVSRGENAGRMLHHAPVVRWFQPLGTVQMGSWSRKAALHLDPSWRPAHLRVIAVVQDPRTAAVVALGSAVPGR
jgi:hypothetical protein